MFSCIYVTEAAFNYPLSKSIIDRYSDLKIMKISHYKDVFNRKNQDFCRQKKKPALILATNDNELVYPGARTCQDFGAEDFYYTSLIKNCIYDCEYCYLQGMYPGANVVVFVNIEDYFEEVSKFDRPISLCLSYDTDMLALEGLTGFAGQWCEYLREHKNVLAEIRTKCGSLSIFDRDIPDNLVLAYTISPPEAAGRYEHGAASYELRKKAFYKSLSLGVKTRLCIDPIIPVENFEEVYGAMIDDIFADSAAGDVKDVSIGSFRISKEYIGNMKKVRLTPFSTYPYCVRDGICGYEEEINGRIVGFVREKLLKYISEDRIYADER
ncbi:MAG: radical SAM protein [Clostridiales bacterium]|nr:radical SAM protein [Clostridiales bacterium]